MNIVLNGDRYETQSTTLADLLESLNHSENSVATAVNGEFVPVSSRQKVAIVSGDVIEIIAPMAGG